jgi:hypothetical protein
MSPLHVLSSNDSDELDMIDTRDNDVSLKLDDSDDDDDDDGVALDVTVEDALDDVDDSDELEIIHRHRR